ncbi:GspH/FimT family pseudopilin [Alcanivorax limicola]|uniref:GspH/FimT family pseudopilin n=1 Tax=Alcanivorax limicola TaxID=2874102 RepID=UPI001CBAAA9D|nr:GspH/FimT family protein [Alcanivorax limicola]
MNTVGTSTKTASERLAQTRRATARLSARQRGVTLVELVVTLVVASITLAIAVPSFNNLNASANMRSTATDLISAINGARADAVNLRGQVTLRPITGSDWSSGWVIDYSSGTLNEENREFLPARGVTVSEESDIASLVFLPNGTVNTQARFELCGPNDGRLIDVSRVGRISNTNQSCP